MEVELEKEIMTAKNQFIVRLHGVISDYEYYYFLMGEVTFFGYQVRTQGCRLQSHVSAVI